MSSHHSPDRTQSIPSLDFYLLNHFIIPPQFVSPFLNLHVILMLVFYVIMVQPIAGFWDRKRIDIDLKSLKLARFSEGRMLRQGFQSKVTSLFITSNHSTNYSDSFNTLKSVIQRLTPMQTYKTRFIILK